MICKNCEKSFEASREWQVFCGTVCRKEYHRLHSTQCFYCGKQENCHRDHIIPQAHLGTRGFENRETVPACGECNRNLTCFMFKDVVKRVEHLLVVYRKKWKLFRPIVEWTDEELAKVGKNLKKDIKNSLKERRQHEERYLFLKAVKKDLTYRMPR